MIQKRKRRLEALSLLNSQKKINGFSGTCLISNTHRSHKISDIPFSKRGS
jgi:hypothetical protein